MNMDDPHWIYNYTGCYECGGSLCWELEKNYFTLFTIEVFGDDDSVGFVLYAGESYTTGSQIDVFETLWEAQASGWLCYFSGIVFEKPHRPASPRDALADMISEIDSRPSLFTKLL
jgi:hypothetical protein